MPRNDEGWGLGEEVLSGTTKCTESALSRDSACFEVMQGPVGEMGSPMELRGVLFPEVLPTDDVLGRHRIETCLEDSGTGSASIVCGCYCPFMRLYYCAWRIGTGPSLGPKISGRRTLGVTDSSVELDGISIHATSLTESSEDPSFDAPCRCVVVDSCACVCRGSIRVGDSDWPWLGGVESLSLASPEDDLNMILARHKFLESWWWSVNSRLDRCSRSIETWSRQILID